MNPPWVTTSLDGLAEAIVDLTETTLPRKQQEMSRNLTQFVLIAMVIHP